MHRVARLSFFLLVIASRAEAQLQSVTIRVKDQAGQQIPGSKVVVDGMGTFDTGGIVPLLPGSQVIDVWPGINAFPQSELVRRETVTIVAGQTVLDFEWITTNVTIHLRDQHGVEIPSSRATIAGVGGLPYTLTPFAITLPITDPGTYPTAGGNAAEGANNGYDVQLVPGFAGTSSFGSLIRFPGNQGSSEAVVVHAGTTVLDFRWITSRVTFHLKPTFRRIG